jgi:hypothetical protein
MIKHLIVAASLALGFAGSAVAQTTLDGLVNDLGVARATDPIRPAAGEGGAGNNGPMDLQSIFVADNGTTVAIGLTVAQDFTGGDWGKYKIFIQTNNGGAAGTSDPWGRAITAPFGAHYVLSTWVDGGGGFNFHKWNGASWDLLGTGASFALSANGNPGSFGGVEFWISRAALGNPATIQVQATCTGGGGGDNGQDAVPSQANATDWGTNTALNTPTSSIAVPVSMSEFAVE